MYYTSHAVFGWFGPFSLPPGGSIEYRVLKGDKKMKATLISKETPKGEYGANAVYCVNQQYHYIREGEFKDLDCDDHWIGPCDCAAPRQIEDIPDFIGNIAVTLDADIIKKGIRLMQCFHGFRATQECLECN